MTKPTRNSRSRPPRYQAARRDADARADGIANVLTNLGGRGDPNIHNKYMPTDIIDRETLERIYRGDGVGRRVVDLLPDEALREWIVGDHELCEELKRVKAKQIVREAGCWARLYGGAVIFAIVDDGEEPQNPIRPNAIRRIMGLRVYDRHRVVINQRDTATNSEFFGEPLTYFVTPPSGTTFTVHRSRLHIMDGLQIPQDKRSSNQGWGDSALQTVYDALKNYGMTMNATAGIVRDFIQVIIGMKGLGEMFAQGQDDIVQKRISTIDMTRSVNNSIFLDADGEQYSKQASSVAGLSDLWDRFAMHISACTGIPSSKLMGRQLGSLASTGDGERKQWYDTIRSYQSDEIQPAIDWVVNLLGLQLDWQDKPESLEWAFPALEQVNELEWAQVKKTTAETDSIYISNGAIDPEYIYHLRYSSGEFKTDIQVTDEGYNEWLMTRQQAMPTIEPEALEQPEPEQDDDEDEPESTSNSDAILENIANVLGTMGAKDESE